MVRYVVVVFEYFDYFFKIRIWYEIEWLIVNFRFKKYNVMRENDIYYKL